MHLRAGLLGLTHRKRTKAGRFPAGESHHRNGMTLVVAPIGRRPSGIIHQVTVNLYLVTVVHLYDNLVALETI